MAHGHFSVSVALLYRERYSSSFKKRMSVRVKNLQGFEYRIEVDPRVSAIIIFINFSQSRLQVLLAYFIVR